MVASDLLYIDGDSLALRPFAERRGELAALLRPSSWCLAGRGFIGDGSTVATALGALGFRALSARRLDAPLRHRARARRLVPRPGHRCAARAAAIPRAASSPAALIGPGQGTLPWRWTATGRSATSPGRPSPPVRSRTRRRPGPRPVGRGPGRPGMPASAAVPSAAGGCGRFVVHRHRASRLHYDLRLEIDGVLVSWALPKGPTRDPDERRFAARTEDHPIAYLDFEGVIPAGEYGAGDSICWDWGTFEPELTWDPAEALRSGELKLRLRGEKLAGRFTLVRTATPDRERTGPRSPGTATDERTAWLLIAKRGPEAIPGWDPEAYPASVKTGRTNADVAAGLPPREARLAPAPLPSLDPPGARTARQPVFVEPMLATPGSAPFDDDDWLFEPKWDGYRIQASVSGGHVALRTRNGHDAARLFPELLGRPTWLAAPAAIIDGEVVALDSRGRPDFGLLQARLGGSPGAPAVPMSRPAREEGRAAPLVFMAFDLLWCAGRSYLDVSLEDRTAILRLVLREHPRVRFGGQVARDGIAFFAATAEQGLEGAMAKHRRSRYEAGRRSSAWLKLKVRPTQELVVAGYVPGQGSHRDLGALIVGVMQGGRLRYAGRVGSGLDAATRARLQGRARCPCPGRAAVRGCARGPGTDRGCGVGRARAGDPGRDRRLVPRRHRPPGLVHPRGARGRPCLGGTPGRRRSGRSCPGTRPGSRGAAVAPNHGRTIGPWHRGGGADGASGRRTGRPRDGDRPGNHRGDRRARGDALPRRALGDLGSRGGPDQPRQGARPGYRILATFSAGARGGQRGGRGQRARDQARPRPLSRPRCPRAASAPGRPRPQPGSLPRRRGWRVLLAEGRGGRDA